MDIPRKSQDICQDDKIAEAILNANTPGDAKLYSKCIKSNSMWDNKSYELMHAICLSAALQNTNYKRNILKTDNKPLIETIQGQFYWGSGLDFRQTRRINFNHLPGKNFMGKILMSVREHLYSEQDQQDGAMLDQ